MEKTLQKIQPKHYGLIAAVLSALGMYIILSVCQYTNGGKYIVLYRDYLEQYVPYIKMFFRNILEGESIWFSWSTSLGMNTSLVNLYYVMSPFNILYLIFWNIDENIITVVILISKIAVSAYTFQMFSRKVLKAEGLESIFFSITYALSMYMVLYGHMYNSWLEGMYMLPLICVFIYELSDLKSYLKLIIAYAYIFVTQFYFAYMVGIFTFLFWIILLFVQKEQSVKLIIKKSAKYVGSVLLAVGISAVFLLPAVVFLFNNYGGSGFVNEKFPTQIFHLFYALFWGNKIPMTNNYPAIYSGWPVLILVILYFVNRQISKKEKIISGILLGLLTATMLIDPLYIFMHAFDEPNALLFRHAFLLVFLLCAIACRQARNYADIKWKQTALIVCVCLGAYMILERFCSQNTEQIGLRFAVNIVCGIIWIGMIYLLNSSRIKKNELSFIIIGVLMVELCMNGWYGISYSDAVQKKDYECWKQGMTDIMSAIDDEEYYRAYYDLDLAVNSDAWFGYNGMADFCSVVNDNVYNVQANLGMLADVHKIYSYGITPPVETIFGVKYSLEGPIPAYQYDDSNTCIIKENPYCLSLGYMVNKEIMKFEFESYNDFENINSLMQAMSGQQVSCFEPFSGTIMAECYQSDMYQKDSNIVIFFDPTEYDYGLITYYISAEEVARPIYSEIIWETDSVGISTSPYIMHGIENIIQQTGLISTPYIKPMILGEDRYEMVILMNHDTEKTWLYKDVVFYEYNEEALVKIYNDLSEEQLKINEFKNGYVKGIVNVSGNKDILFTTIPYDSGWQVSVDNEKVKPFAVLDDAFIALELEPGVHEIEFRYVTPALKEGVVITCISLSAFVAMLVYGILLKKSVKKIKED